MAAAACPLISVAVLERDSITSETMCTWCYPTLGDLEPVVLARARLDDDEVPTTVMYSKFNNTWIYILSAINTNTRSMPQVEVFSIALVSKTFDPEKHGALLKLMSEAYGESGDPLRVLEGFLSVFAKGAWEAKSSKGSSFGRYADSDHDARMAMLQSSIKALVAELGQESIFLWNALLCKKRVALYSASAAKLQHAVRATPLLVWHNTNMWSGLRPLVNLESTVELADLKNCKHYVAGFTESAVRNREDLWDLLVDVDAGEFTISENAQNDFLLCSVHKDVAKYMLEASSGTENDQGMIKGLCLKTKQLLEKLNTLKSDHGLGKPTIAREDLEAVGGKNMDVFLWQVAIAEGMTT